MHSLLVGLLNGSSLQYGAHVVSYIGTWTGCGQGWVVTYPGNDFQQPAYYADGTFLVSTVTASCLVAPSGTALVHEVGE